MNNTGFWCGQEKQLKSPKQKSNGWSFPLFWPEDVRNSFWAARDKTSQWITPWPTRSSQHEDCWTEVTSTDPFLRWPTTEQPLRRLYKHQPACSHLLLSDEANSFPLANVVHTWDPAQLARWLDSCYLDLNFSPLKQNFTSHFSGLAHGAYNNMEWKYINGSITTTSCADYSSSSRTIQCLKLNVWAFCIRMWWTKSRLRLKLLVIPTKKESPLGYSSLWSMMHRETFFICANQVKLWLEYLRGFRGTLWKEGEGSTHHPSASYKLHKWVM